MDFHEELTIEDGLVLKGTRIVIPKSKHKQVLTMIHKGHLGLGKCKLQIKRHSVNNITSSPHYPQLNGLAEKYVQIVKNLFYKAQEEGTDICKSLMMYRNTPLSNKLQSPMQILQSQAVRTQLPMSNVARTQRGLGSEQ